MRSGPKYEPLINDDHALNSFVGKTNKEESKHLNRKRHMSTFADLSKRMTLSSDLRTIATAVIVM